MSRLYDSIVHKSNMDLSTQANFEGHGWFIAKPLNRNSFRRRLRDAWRVLTGRSFAVHYFEDEE